MVQVSHSTPTQIPPFLQQDDATVVSLTFTPTQLSVSQSLNQFASPKLQSLFIEKDLQWRLHHLRRPAIHPLQRPSISLLAAAGVYLLPTAGDSLLPAGSDFLIQHLRRLQLSFLSSLLTSPLQMVNSIRKRRKITGHQTTREESGTQSTMDLDLKLDRMAWINFHKQERQMTTAKGSKKSMKEVRDAWNTLSMDEKSKFKMAKEDIVDDKVTLEKAAHEDNKVPAFDTRCTPV
ncbi:hypothetical protein LWI29_011191 [Acer saccharum]|uniref:Uncharacterized protein n=1 Tax=Acer saccharum TaxID=4024 RepID=A0AA39SFW9_ACESA|nr:hypothetical protein LWI29_011191 [Acer saccharum]